MTAGQQQATLEHGRPAAALPDHDIVAAFESLGDNCEFGLVQRTAGLEPLGFFRFNFAAMEPLLRALDSDFAGIDTADRLEIYTEPNGELMVRILDYGFQYHTHLRTGEVDVDQLRFQQLRSLRFLAEKLLEDLRTGEKIFVRKGDGGEADMLALHRAVRRHGEGTLLWVTPQDETHPSGTVEIAAAGLLRGYIDRFAPYADAYDFSAAWFALCHNAAALRRDFAHGVANVGARRDGQPEPGANLIRGADQFGGEAWWLASNAGARPSTAIPPLHPGSAVAEHVLVEETRQETGAIFGHQLSHSMADGAMHAASLSLWLPPDFTGTLVGAVMNGFPSVHMVNADVGQRGVWQRVWVSARVPPGVNAANPSLYVLGPRGTRLFSTCWKLEMGSRPTAYEPAPPRLLTAPDVPAPQAPPAATLPQTQAQTQPGPAAAAEPAGPSPAAAPAAGIAYRIASLETLASRLTAAMPDEAGGRFVERLPLFAAGTLALPAAAFGDQPLAAARLARPAASAYLLRDAIVHGRGGTITIGDCAVLETLPPEARPDGAAAEDAIHILPDHPAAARINTGYHLLAPLANAGHATPGLAKPGAPTGLDWLTAVLSRFRAEEFRRLAGQPGPAGAPILLIPPLDTPARRQFHALLIAKATPCVSLDEAGRIAVAHLLYVPDISGQSAGAPTNPHPALLDAFDSMRAAALAGVPAKAPWRRLYLWQGEDARGPAGETAIADHLKQAGFTVVSPATLPAAEQIRLFAEASHIVAASGPALIGLGFCQPGTALCELRPPASSPPAPAAEPAFRHLAALRGLRYGRLTGTAASSGEGAWHLDPAALDRLLQDPAFIAPPAAGAGIAPANPAPSRRWWDRFRPGA